DIGVLRRSNSKISNAAGSRRLHNRKAPTSILESSCRPNSDADQSNRNEPRDRPNCEEPAPRRVPVDPGNLAVDQSHRLSTQNVNTAYRPYGNQRVRDWLREAGVAWEHSAVDVMDTQSQSAMENSERKNSGCLSDRPARRIHSLANPNNVPVGPPTDHSSPSALTPNVENVTLESTEQGKMLPRGMGDTAASRVGPTKPDVLGSWNPEQLRHSSEISRAQRDFHSISGPSIGQGDTRKSLTPSSVSDKTDDPRVKGNLECDSPASPQSNSTATERSDVYRENGNQSQCYNGHQQRPQRPEQNIMHQSERSAYPVVAGLNLDTVGVSTRQRSFPRTNPTVSRSVPGGTNSRSARFSATTLDRPTNTGYSSVNTGSNKSEQRNSTPAVQRTPTFNVVHFSNTDLRITVPNASSGLDNASSPLKDTKDSSNKSLEDPSSPDFPYTRTNHVPTTTTINYEQGAKSLMPGNSKDNHHNSNSPASISPQPSSSSSSTSSSSSFSRASSGTALTNTDSEENKHVVHSAPDQLLDSVIHAYPAPRRASLNQENKSVEFNPFQQQPHQQLQQQQPLYPVSPEPNKIDSNIDLDQPPIPPPRSASTLGPNRVLQHCTSDFYRLAQGDMLVRSDPYALTQRPYALYYPRYPQYMVQQHIPHIDGPLLGEGRAVSSLSRKDPTRANVIPPNHRRPPPFIYQTRPPYPMSGPTTIYYLHQFDGPVHEASVNYASNANVGAPNATNRLSSTSSPLLPSTGVELCSIGGSGNGPTGATSPSTATTWVSHSTATWDLEKLRAEHSQTVPTSDCELQSQPLAPAVHPAGETPISIGTTSTGNSGNTAAVLHRSPSGGFIGPEELNDSVWYSTSDRDRVGTPSVPLFTLVQPGHPQFPSFIAPFDWPRTLFKPDQDVSSLMSWTKSTFSKRLLVSTEPNMKKQAADTFKIVQSFMGDRKARLSLPDYGSIIVHRALNTVGLRDEIFAQLCKQTTGNSDIKSLTNGWALICVCLYYFPPNSKFRDALLAYLNARADAAVSLVFPSAHSLNKVPSSLEAAAAIASGLAPIVSELKPVSNGHTVSYSQATTTTRASTIGSTRSDALLSESSDLFESDLLGSTASTSAARRMNNSQSNAPRPFEFSIGLWDRPTAAHFARVAPRWFVRALNVGPRKLLEAPSIEEICHVKDFILKPSIFGGTLTEMMRIQAYRFPHLRLPWIQIFLTEELLRLNGPVTEGVFR
ncbi:unnamed protein product, partial [Echinostoma caproni]|uniref:MyTH4 domain-containing protein n=1 Tax=Echinostoma caproni TaxID=27848 RepID=A0A183A657_9TREM